jgi:hypothetical protein
MFTGSTDSSSNKFIKYKEKGRGLTRELQFCFAVFFSSPMYLGLEFGLWTELCPCVLVYQRQFTVAK